MNDWDKSLADSMIGANGEADAVGTGNTRSY